MSTLLVLMTGLVLSGSLPERDILGQADARIERYRKGNAVLRLIGPGGKPMSMGRAARIEQTRHAFCFGSNIFRMGLYETPKLNAAYEKYFTELMTFGTLPFYAYNVDVKGGKPDFERNDGLARWCREHGITAKGHPLVWNMIDPPWLPDNSNAVAEAQWGYLGQCMEHFRHDIQVWDVVNEAAEYERPECESAAPKLTEAIRRMGLGNFLRSAFKRAREANPKAVLIINDYCGDERYEDRVLKELEENGRPLYDAIGIQSHQHAKTWSAWQLWDVCERFAKYKKPLHFTEVSILSGKLGWKLAENNPGFDWESTPQGEQRQAEEVCRFYTVLFSHPAVAAITWWNLSDRYSWQRAPSGLLRTDMTPKPAYESLKRLVKGRWWSRAETPVGQGGELAFRGFFGEYQVAVTDGSRQLNGNFSLAKPTAPGAEGPGRIEVRLQ